MDDQTTIASAAGNAQASMTCTELVGSVEPDDSHRLASAEFDRQSWLDLG